MEVKYYLEDGAVLTAPNASEEALWEAMKNSSKFDCDTTIEQYRLSFISRLELTKGIKWHDIWIESDLATLKNCDYIAKVECLTE